jgi:(1->4)-alpha-D-glucan 1-alpha-D-glucosylmutase
LSDDTIDRLARLQGIEPGFRDNWGRTHTVATSTRSALLGAMGIRVSDPAAIAAEIEARERSRRRLLLPPVLVVRLPATAIEVPLWLPSARSNDRFGWELIEEGARRRRGLFVPAELSLGEEREVAGRSCEQRFLRIDGLPEPGYHTLRVEPLGGTRLAGGASPLIVAPETCFRPEAVSEGNRVWGVAVQLYALRSERNWGIGDFTDLLRLVEVCAAAGADLVTVSPLHLLFPRDPEHAAPYSPSSRALLNVLHHDVEAIPDHAESDEARALVGDAAFRRRLAALRRAELVDYRGVWEAKRVVLETIYAGFRERHLSRESERGRAFRDFQRSGGEALRAYGVFECLQERFATDWREWPAKYREPDSDAVERVARSDRERVELFQYLQWQAELQLGAVGRRSLALGLGVGLGLDLALGAHGSGFDAWYWDGLARGASIGAPPDAFSPSGQDWGLPPPVPSRLTDSGYASFVAALRAGMRHAGALRVDHVMGLMRLFWIPEGRQPSAGAYVRYPLDDLLGILALESRRGQCMVVGEDLGTVPDEVRRAMDALGVLSYRPLYFMKEDDGGFVDPSDYPRNALVAATTHDLPTLAGWLEGTEVRNRDRLGLLPEGVTGETALAARAAERERLLRQLVDAGQLAEVAATEDQILAIHRWLARSPARVLTLQLEDVMGCREQANLPGTTGEQHPNWRRKLPLPLEELAEDPRWLALARALRDERGERRGTR